MNLDIREWIEVEAVLLRVTRDIPIHSIYTKSLWPQLAGLQLADPCFGTSSKIDLLLGVDVFVTHDLTDCYLCCDNWLLIDVNECVHVHVLET